MLTHSETYYKEKFKYSEKHYNPTRFINGTQKCKPIKKTKRENWFFYVLLVDLVDTLFFKTVVFLN